MSSTLSVPPAEAPSPLPERTAPLPRYVRPTLLAGCGLGLLAQWLFHGHDLGLSFPLFLLALLATLATLGGREAWQRARHARWLLLPTLFFSTLVAVRADPLLIAANALASLALLLLLAHLHAGEHLTSLRLGGYLHAVAEPLSQSLTRPPALLHSGLDVSASRAWLGRHGSPLLRGLALASPVLALFGLLLCMADPLFARAVAGLLSGVSLSSLGQGLYTLLFSAACAWLAIGWLAQALRRSRPLDAQASPPERAASGPIGFIEGLTVLGSVAILFSAFIALQVGRLLQVIARQLSSSFTYSEYARQGFFELTTVACLSLLLLMALQHLVRREGPSQEHLFRLAGTTLVGLVLVLLGIALRRMSLYEEAYGLTRLRLFSHLFSYALGALLLWRALTLWWGGEPRFALGAFCIALTWGAALNLLNPDGYIVRYNLQRFAATGKLDEVYLLTLSEDSLPTLAEELAHLEQTRGGPDTHMLRILLAQRAPPAMPRGWQELHLGRWRATRALALFQADAR
jgi:hypothetical protein